MGVEVKIKYDKRKWKALQKHVRQAPKEIKDGIVVAWNSLALDFRTLMQDKHLNAPPGKGPSPYKDKLRRISSNLYSSIDHDVKIISRGDIQVAVFYRNKKSGGSAVSDYAPTHEYGDSKRGIPSRMGMRKEWRSFKNKFYNEAMAQISKEMK